MATEVDLARDFGSVMAKVERAAYLPVERQPSLAEHLLASVASATIIQTPGPSTGVSLLAQLGRSQDLIEAGNLAGALAEMGHLDEAQVRACVP